MATSPAARSQSDTLDRLLPLLGWSAWSAVGFVLLIWLHEVGHAIATVALQGESSIPLIGISGPAWALSGKAPSEAYYSTSGDSRAMIKLAGPITELGLCYAAALTVLWLKPRGRWLAFAGGLAFVPLIFRGFELASMAVSGWSGDLQKPGEYLGRDIAQFGYPLWLGLLLVPAAVYIRAIIHTRVTRSKLFAKLVSMSVVSAFAFALGFIASSVVASHL